MKLSPFLWLCICGIMLLALSSLPPSALAQDTGIQPDPAPEAIVGGGFTYQGQLSQTGKPFTGNCDFQFTLWDSAGAGSQVAVAVAKPNVAVSQGVFAVADITFGISNEAMYLSFNGSARWLQVGVRCPPGSGAYTTLLPRQAMAATPYALSLRPGAQIVGDVFSTPPYNNVLKLENKSTTAGPDGADALNAVTRSDWGAAVRGTAEKGRGGAFSSYAGFALVTSGPSLLQNRTPQQIAMLRWYDANRAAPSVNVGFGANQFAFDGEFMWVTVFGDNEVVKIHASDMAVIGSYPAGTAPNPIAFDGRFIWVGSESGGQVTKLRASDGGLAADFSTGSSGHSGMAFDGANIWVTNRDTDNVTKIRASDNAILAVYPVGDNPSGIAFDGSSVWVANTNAGTVSKLNPSTGAVTGTYPVGSGPNGIAFDGANIWVANSGSSSVSVLRAYDGSQAHLCSVSASPFLLAFDGYYVWVTHYISSGIITKLSAASQLDCGPAPTFATGSYPFGIAFDGANIWVADSYSQSVSKH